jgi:hypothetical protein
VIVNSKSGARDGEHPVRNKNGNRSFGDSTRQRPPSKVSSAYSKQLIYRHRFWDQSALYYPLPCLNVLYILYFVAHDTLTGRRNVMIRISSVGNSVYSAYIVENMPYRIILYKEYRYCMMP